MIRTSLVTLALTAGMVAGSAGVASAHECFIANRSDKGNAGAAHSANWEVLQVAELYAVAHVILSENKKDPELPALTEEEIAEAVRLTEAAGIPTSVAVFHRHMLPRSVEELEQLTGPTSSDGKGVDHYVSAYAEQIIGICLALVFPPA